MKLLPVCTILGVMCSCLSVVSLSIGDDLSAVSEFRTWTSSGGKFKVDGRLISSDGTTVVLELKGSGRQVTVPLNRLIAADQKYARDLLSQSTPAELSPEQLFPNGKPYARYGVKFHYPAKDEYYIAPRDSGGGQLILVARELETEDGNDIENLAGIEVHPPGSNQPSLQKLLAGKLKLSKKRLEKLEADGSLKYQLEGYPATVRKSERAILGEVRNGYLLTSNWPIGRPTVTEHYALKLPGNYVGQVWATRTLEQENHEPLLEMICASLDASGLAKIDPHVFHRWGLRFPLPKDVQVNVNEELGGYNNSVSILKNSSLAISIRESEYNADTTAAELLTIQRNNYDDEADTLKDSARTFLGARQQGFRHERELKGQPYAVEYYALNWIGEHRFLEIRVVVTVGGNDNEKLVAEVLNSLERTK